MALLEGSDTTVVTPKPLFDGANTGDFTVQAEEEDPITRYLEDAGITKVLGPVRMEAAVRTASMRTLEKKPTLDDVLKTMFAGKNDLRRRLSDQLLRSPTPRLDFDGRYVLLGELAQGGQGIVTYAMDCKESVPKLVVLKTTTSPVGKMKGWEQGRFEREWKILERMEGEHTSKLVDHGMTPGATPDERYPYFSMELVEGHPLSKIIDAHGKPMPESVAVAVARGAAVALGAVHKKTGGPHRDVKPANLILTDEGKVKVIDFGLAALAELEKDDPATRDQIQKLTATGTVFGTPFYMAPEQSEDSGKVDLRADIYSLGVILYQMLTGSNPFAGEGIAATFARQKNFVPDFLQIKNRKLAAVLKKMLAKDPNSRYASMEKAIVALDEAMQGEVAIALASSKLSPDEAPIGSNYGTSNDMMAALLRDETRNDVGIQKPALLRVLAHRYGTRRNAFFALLAGGAITLVSSLPWSAREKEGSSGEAQPNAVVPDESPEQLLQKEGKYRVGLSVDPQQGGRLELPNGLTFEPDQLIQLYDGNTANSQSNGEWRGACADLNTEQLAQLLKIQGDPKAGLPNALQRSVLYVYSHQTQNGRVTLVQIASVGSFVLRPENGDIADFYSAAEGGIEPVKKVVNPVLADVRDVDQSLRLPEIQAVLESYGNVQLHAQAGGRYQPYIKDSKKPDVYKKPETYAKHFVEDAGMYLKRGVSMTQK